jgi:hypothetical protein
MTDQSRCKNVILRDMNIEWNLDISPLIGRYRTEKGRASSDKKRKWLLWLTEKKPKKILYLTLLPEK